IDADGVVLRRAGFAAIAPSGEEITGSAAAMNDDESPATRAYFELLERVSTIEALDDPRDVVKLRCKLAEPIGYATKTSVFPESDSPNTWRYARSNGIAIYEGWIHAARRAWLELLERDRILRAWYGETCPVRLRFDFAETILGDAESYAWEAY